VQAGKYFVHVVVGDEKSGDTKDLTTFVVGEVVGARSDNDPHAIPSFNPANPVDPDPAVALIGSASFDPNGTIVTYFWVQTGGNAVVIVDDSMADTTFGTAGADTYSFTLTVTDNGGNTDTSSITIIVT